MNEVNNLADDDIKALLDYYRARAANLEYEYLTFQLKAQKEINLLNAELADARVTVEPTGGDEPE